MRLFREKTCLPLVDTVHATSETDRKKRMKGETRLIIFTFLLLKLPSGTIYTKRINIFAHTGGQTEYRIE